MASLKTSLILLFVLLLTVSLFADAAPPKFGRFRKTPPIFKPKCVIGSSEKQGFLPKAASKIIPTDAKFKFLLHADGDQIYTCNATAATPDTKWKFVAEANLFNQEFRELVGKHFFQKTATANGGRPTWASTLRCDDSSVTTKLKESIPSPNGPRNIAWLLTEKTDVSGKGAFSDVTHVARVRTKGGISPPPEACGTRKFKNGSVFKSPYTSEYWFFTKPTKA